MHNKSLHKKKLVRKLNLNIFSRFNFFEDELEKLRSKSGKVTWKKKEYLKKKLHNKYILKLFKYQRKRYNFYKFAVNNIFRFNKVLLKLTRRKLNNVSKNTLNSGSMGVVDLYQKLQNRMDVLLFRMNYAPTIEHARQLIYHKRVFLDGRCVRSPMKIATKGQEIEVRNSNILWYKLPNSGIFIDYGQNRGVLY